LNFSKHLNRKRNFKIPKVKFWLFCEGKNTEPDYFQAVAKKYDQALIELVFQNVGTDAKTISNNAIQKYSEIKSCKSLSENDKVWVVFDRDANENVINCVNNCKKKRVGVAFSNPCFELWLILHFEDFDKPLDRHKVQSHLEKLIAGYDRKKGKTANWDQIMEFVEVAENRAEKQMANRISEGGNIMTPPNTTVYKLTLEIRETANSLSQ
jgi:hypothetical protein